MKKNLPGIGLALAGKSGHAGHDPDPKPHWRKVNTAFARDKRETFAQEDHTQTTSKSGTAIQPGRLSGAFDFAFALPRRGQHVSKSAPLAEPVMQRCLAPVRDRQPPATTGSLSIARSPARLRQQISDGFTAS